MCDEIMIVHPLDGDFVNRYDGLSAGSALEIQICVSKWQEGLSINNVPVKLADGVPCATIKIDGFENPVLLTDKDGTVLHRITIYRLEESVGTYRLSLDDNIWCLKDIAQNSGSYRSIFDNSYMAFYKQLNDTYGTKVHFNIYYQTDGFTLKDMPDKFKNEWKENSNWLRLTFHALQNDPDKPYKDASYETVKRDCEMVTEQIIRFAGEESLSPFTTVHWGEANREGCRALKDLGFKGLIGYFRLAEGKPVVSYYHDVETTKHVSGRDMWRDHSNGLFFIKNDMVINSYRISEIVPLLEELYKYPSQAGFIELMIHEQYFYPSYFAYQPDYKEKVTSAIEWVTEKGYKPVLISELFKGHI